jgi:type VI secretion system secreted protein VgrG
MTVELDLKTGNIPGTPSPIAVPGASMDTTSSPAGSTIRYFDGLVTRFTYLGMDGKLGVFEAEVRPWLWLLKRRKNCRIFQNKTALDIIKAIFADHSFANYVDRTIASPPMRMRTFCVQYNESDFDFVSRLMEQEGIYYHFEHQEKQHKLVLINNLSTHQPCPTLDRIEFHRNLRTSQLKNDIIWTWEASAELQSDKVVLDDYDFEKPMTSLLKAEQVFKPGSDRGLEVYEWPGDYRQPQDGATYAKLRAEEIACRVQRVRAEGNTRTLLPGYTFALIDVDQPTGPASRRLLPGDMQTVTVSTAFDYEKPIRPDQEQRFLVLGIEFRIVDEVGEALRNKGTLFLYECKVEGLLATTQYRPPRTTPHPVIPGPQSALVVGVPGDDITTEQYGRVKLQFFWDREGQKNENSSCWIRVVQNWAGKQWGGLVTPRIGQEAIVQFLDGNPDWPILTGLAYNAVNMPPYDLPAQATRSTFKTRSSIGDASSYNELRFEDQAGGEEVYLRAQKDYNIDVEQGDWTADVKMGATTLKAAQRMLLSVGPGGTPFASITLTPGGINITAPAMEITAADINVLGNVQIEGNLLVTGPIEGIVIPPG